MGALDWMQKAQTQCRQSIKKNQSTYAGGLPALQATRRELENAWADGMSLDENWWAPAAVSVSTTTEPRALRAVRKSLKRLRREEKKLKRKLDASGAR